jgi:hypothetical protein
LTSSQDNTSVSMSASNLPAGAVITVVITTGCSISRATRFRTLKVPSLRALATRASQGPPFTAWDPEVSECPRTRRLRCSSALP